MGRQDLSSMVIDETEVLDVLRRLQIDKSPGPDGSHPRVLKECATEMAYPLTVLFRSSLREGRLPEKWKDANVTTVFKNGSRTNASNYRPVSLTSVCFKVLERLITKSLLKQMIDNGFLSEYLNTSMDL